MQAVVLEDIFEISDKDPDGKKFDKGAWYPACHIPCRQPAWHAAAGLFYVVVESVLLCRLLLPAHCETTSLIQPVGGNFCPYQLVCSVEDQGRGRSV
jgi:hypothetical protein